MDRDEPRSLAARLLFPAEPIRRDGLVSAVREARDEVLRSLLEPRPASRRAGRPWWRPGWGRDRNVEFGVSAPDYGAMIPLPEGEAGWERAMTAIADGSAGSLYLYATADDPESQAVSSSVDVSLVWRDGSLARGELARLELVTAMELVDRPGQVDVISLWLRQSAVALAAVWAHLTADEVQGVTRHEFATWRSPSEALVSARRWARGPEWGIILSSRHLSALGGRERVLEDAPVHAAVDISLPGYEAVYLQLTRSPVAVSDAAYAALNEFLTPVLRGERERRTADSDASPSAAGHPLGPRRALQSLPWVVLEVAEDLRPDNLHLELTPANGPLDYSHVSLVAAVVAQWARDAVIGGMEWSGPEVVGCVASVSPPFRGGDTLRWDVDLGTAPLEVLGPLVEALDSALGPLGYSVRLRVT